MKFFNKYFIFFCLLFLFFFIAYVSLNSLAPENLTYGNYPQIHLFLIPLNTVLLFAWILLGTVFGVTLSVLAFSLIMLVSNSTGYRWFLIYTAVTTFTSITAYYFFSKNIHLRRALKLFFEKKIENKNTFLDQYNKQEQIAKALDKKTHRYSHLKMITESLSSSLLLEDLSKEITEKTVNLIGKTALDTCLLFIIDEEKLELSLTGSRNKKSSIQIKEKKGDIFDQWVLRQRQPLNITDIKKDFRFSLSDVEKINRNFLSLLSVPMITENRIVGLLRIDSPKADNFSPDDLRLLDIVSDLSAVGLENATLYKRIKELAIIDDLTGLYLKRHFHEYFRNEYNRALKYNNNLNILMLDIDHFKQYNDIYGHTAGDIVLKMVAKILEENTGKGNIAVRFGGEEFIVLYNSIDKKTAIKRAENIRLLIENHPILLRRKKTNITVSIGISNFPEDTKIRTELIHIADINLYKAKTEGRNRICYS